MIHLLETLYFSPVALIVGASLIAILIVIGLIHNAKER